MSERIFLANVGANASHRFASPIFEDETFEFLPIPENPNIPLPHALQYRDLRSHYQQSKDLLDYIPKRLWDKAAHNDPEFRTFTYGDNCEISPRAKALKHLQPGDFLFFLARMVRWNDTGATEDYGFYFVGFFEIASTYSKLTDVQQQPQPQLIERFRENSHIRRGMTHPKFWDRFWVFRGSCKSQRFPHAIPVNRQLCEEVFTTAKGSTWRWDTHRSELQTIGSYTRSCRCVIDPSTPGGSARRDTFWDWIKNHTSY